MIIEVHKIKRLCRQWKQTAGKDMRLCQEVTGPVKKMRSLQKVHTAQKTQKVYRDISESYDARDTRRFF